MVVGDFPYHITARANNGEFILKEDEDKEIYSGLFVENAMKNGLKVYAWCIMGNHVHFVLEPPDEHAFSETFKIVQQRFSRYVNKKNNAYGPNWQRRFHTTPLDKPHLYEAIRYVELNPVRADITEEIETYRWSSARGRFNGSHEIFVDSVSKYLEIDDWWSYLQEPHDQVMIDNIKSNAEQGIPSGDEIFMTAFEKLKNKALRRRPMGRPKKS